MQLAAPSASRMPVHYLPWPIDASAFLTDQPAGLAPPIPRCAAAKKLLCQGKLCAQIPLPLPHIKELYFGDREA